MSHDPQHGDTPPGQGYPPPGNYPQQGYPPPGYYPQQAYAAPPTNTMAVLSLVFAFVFTPLAIIFGHIARKQIARTGEGGRGLATAGLVLGYIFLAIGLLAIIGLIILASAASSHALYSAGQFLLR